MIFMIYLRYKIRINENLYARYPDARFVGAVCWKRRSNILLAANSHGYIKVLEAV